jgi:hypothetical protein
MEELRVPRPGDEPHAFAFGRALVGVVEAVAFGGEEGCGGDGLDHVPDAGFGEAEGENGGQDLKGSADIQNSKREEPRVLLTQVFPKFPVKMSVFRTLSVSFSKPLMAAWAAA